jgi:hypothetical protein
MMVNDTIGGNLTIPPPQVITQLRQARRVEKEESDQQLAERDELKARTNELTVEVDR